MYQLSSRAVIGMFYKRLNIPVEKLKWIDAISNYFTSDQDSETYRWIGQSPMMREWIGGRNAKGFTSNGISIENKHFEATIDIPLKHMRRDKTGQIKVRIGELAVKTKTHWSLLLSKLITDGDVMPCYDGKPFFSESHRDTPKQPVQSNKIEFDLANAGINGEVGTETAPTEAAMREAILSGIQQIIGFKDDQGEPFNETASSFLVMVPANLFNVAHACVSVPLTVGGATNPIKVLASMDIAVAGNSRLTDKDTFYVFRADSEVKAFIRQEEEPVKMKAKDETSEYAFDNDACQFGVDSWRNVGYGYWQHATMVTLTKSGE